MRRRTIAGLCLVASLGVLATAASSAAAKTALVFKTAKGPVTPGSDVVWSSPAVTLTLFEDEKGAASASPFGKAIIKTVNNPMGGTTGASVAAKPTRFEGSLTEVSFGVGEGTGFGPEPVNIIMTATGLPWSYEFTSSGAVTIKGAGHIGLEFEVEGSGTTCGYETGRITSSFEVGGVIRVKTTEQPMKANKKSSKKSEKTRACPKQGSLAATFGLTSAGEAVESELRKT